MRAINYSHKYVITDRDLNRAKNADSDKKEGLAQVVADEELLDGFDPSRIETDRRILYEVTGMRLNRDEFRAEGSSSSGEDDLDEPLPFDYAFMYQDAEENAGSSPLAINP